MGSEWGAAVFVQVIEGRPTDETALSRLLARWDTDVKPGAAGFLGVTAGMTTDRTAVVFVRFVDEAAARWNQGRPEHTAWWHELVEAFEEPPTVDESPDIQLLLGGGSDEAQFVQVVRASTPDRARIDALMTPDRIAAVQRSRPDLIGSVRAWLADGSFVEAAYFKSESAARAAEQTDDFQDAEAAFAEAYGPMSFADLAAPVFLSP